MASLEPMRWMQQFINLSCRAIQRPSVSSSFLPYGFQMPVNVGTVPAESGLSFIGSDHQFDDRADFQIRDKGINNVFLLLALRSKINRHNFNDFT